MPRIRGFTLIELLVVVAIIGILTAIAVPNYTDTLVKSKVAKAKGDMHTLEAALVSYYTDRQTLPYAEAYPVHSTCNQNENNVSNNIGMGYLSRYLTTPVAYIGKLPNDPYRNIEDVGPCFPERRTYLYSTDTENVPRFRQNYVSILYSQLKGNMTVTEPRPSSAIWMVSSPGPDQHRDQGPSTGGFPRGPLPVSYDPTNGTISAGDVFMFGPSLGFADDM